MRTCCWPAPRVASGSRRSWRSARRMSTCWSRSRSCCARWSAVWARRPRGSSDGRVSVSGEGPVAAVRDSGSLRHHRPVGGFPRRRRGQRDGIHGAGTRGRPASADTRRDRVHPGVDPGFSGLCAARAGHGTGRIAGRRHRRSGGAHRGLSLRLERADHAVQPPLERRTHRHAADVLRRTFVRCVVVSGHGSRRRAREHLQRPAGGFVCQRRSHLRRPGRFHRRRSARGAGRCRDTIAVGVQPGADHAGPAVLLCRAAPGSARYDPEAAGDPAAGRDRRAGQSRGAGAGGGVRGSGAAGAARRVAPTAPAGDRTAAADRVFPHAGPGLPVHRDLHDREGQSVAE